MVDLGLLCSDQVVNRAFKAYMISYLRIIKCDGEKGLTELVSIKNSLVITKEDIDKLVLSTNNREVILMKMIYLYVFTDQKKC